MSAQGFIDELVALRTRDETAQARIEELLEEVQAAKAETRAWIRLFGEERLTVEESEAGRYLREIKVGMQVDERALLEVGRQEMAELVGKELAWMLVTALAGHTA